ncbi:hypothetical protein [Amycolatopsis sp. NPDC059657]|uniref:hypothetical protein n=1 Tax=Amycolatopsis sp. NPDC059657 TaxID=3346899 RepID=UPI00366E1738
MSALERGERSVTYRDRLTTSDGGFARDMRVRDGRQTIYACGMVNPKYPVLVARFMVQAFGTSACKFSFEASLKGVTTSTRTFTLRGNSNPDSYNVQVFEIAWLHGMPLDEWQDTEAVSALRKCLVRYWAEATANQAVYARPASIHTDATANGFTVGQANVLQAWVQPAENTYAVAFHEPEYMFLAPLTTYPTATAEGTLLQGQPASAGVTSAHHALEGAPSVSTLSVFPDEYGAWPLPPRNFGY